MRISFNHTDWNDYLLLVFASLSRLKFGRQLCGFSPEKRKI